MDFSTITACGEDCARGYIHKEKIARRKALSIAWAGGEAPPLLRSGAPAAEPPGRLAFGEPGFA